MAASHPGVGSGTVWTDTFAGVPSTAPAGATDPAWSPLTKRWTAEHQFAKGGQWIVVAAAMVDQAWAGTNPHGQPSGMAPQAHVVRARTLDGHTATNNGRKIVGRKWWVSTPWCFCVDGDGAGCNTSSVARGTTTSGPPLLPRSAASGTGWHPWWHLTPALCFISVSVFIVDPAQKRQCLHVLAALDAAAHRPATDSVG